jgi:hypothetical protein
MTKVCARTYNSAFSIRLAKTRHKLFFARANIDGEVRLIFKVALRRLVIRSASATLKAIGACN